MAAAAGAVALTALSAALCLALLIRNFSPAPTVLFLDGQDRRFAGLAYTIDRSEGTGIPAGIGYYNPKDEGEGWRPPWHEAKGSQAPLTDADYLPEHSPTLPPAWKPIEHRYADYEEKQEEDTIPLGEF